MKDRQQTPQSTTSKERELTDNLNAALKVYSCPQRDKRGDHISLSLTHTHTHIQQLPLKKKSKIKVLRNENNDCRH